MSEALSPPPAVSPPPPPAAAPAASLYPADGGAAAAAATAASTESGGDTGTSTIAAGSGNDTVAAGSGNDTVSAGTEAAATGNDTVAGDKGSDTLSAASYDFTLPTGFTDNVELTNEAKTVMAAAGVAPDKAQGLVDLFGKAVKANADAQVAAHNQQQQTWVTELNSLPEFTGPTRETSLASIGKLFDEFGTPEAKAALNAYGVGNNPALVKMMLKIASAVSEGGPAASGRPTGVSGKPGPKTVGGALYENDGKGPVRN